MVVGDTITAHGQRKVASDPFGKLRSVARAIDYVLYEQGDELPDFDDN
jgi:hypothetical protein